MNTIQMKLINYKNHSKKYSKKCHRLPQQGCSWVFYNIGQFSEAGLAAAIQSFEVFNTPQRLGDCLKRWIYDSSMPHQKDLLPTARCKL